MLLLNSFLKPPAKLCLLTVKLKSGLFKVRVLLMFRRYMNNCVHMYLLIFILFMYIGLSHLVAASYSEDQFGVVQTTLPSILSFLVVLLEVRHQARSWKAWKIMNSLPESHIIILKNCLSCQKHFFLKIINIIC